MSDLDLDALEATARAATPGPWIIDSLENGEHGIFLPDGHPECGEMGCGGDQVAGFMVSKNAKYIAAANPTTALALTARIREAEEAADGEAAAHNDTIRAWREAEDKLREAEATIDAVREVVEHALHPEQAPTRCGMCRIEGILTRHQDKRENGSGDDDGHDGWCGCETCAPEREDGSRDG